MNIYLYVKVFIFVPRVDFKFIIDHMIDNISYYVSESDSSTANESSVPEFWTRQTSFVSNRFHEDLLAGKGHYLITMTYLLLAHYIHSGTSCVNTHKGGGGGGVS